AATRKRSRRNAVASARPDFIASRRPGDPGDGEWTGHTHLAVRIDDLHISVVVSAQRVVDERDESPVRRDAYVAQPAGGVIQGLSDRIVEPVAVPHVARHRQALAVGRPVGVLHVFEDLARRAPGQRNTRQSPGGFEAEHEVAVEADRELPRGGDREKSGAGEPQRGPLGAPGARRLATASPSGGKATEIMKPPDWVTPLGYRGIPVLPLPVPPRSRNPAAMP